MRSTSHVSLLATVVLLLTVPAVLGGTANDPEILDQPNDSDITQGTLVPHLEITKGWIQPIGENFRFTMEVASLNADNIPTDSVYVFHYTWNDARLYYRAQYNESAQEWEFRGGVYEGCKPPFCGSHDPAGNRQYIYLKGGENQTERLDGRFVTGSPGRIEWEYPMDSYTTSRAGLQFKGLFATTYKKDDAGRLNTVDIGQNIKDYDHKIKSPPWYARFVPGPSPMLVAVGVLAALAVVRHRRDRD